MPRLGFRRSDTIRAVGLKYSKRSNRNSMSAQFQLYTDNKGEFRWRLLANNHEVIAQSSEGYSDKSGAQRGAEILKETGLSGSPEIYQDKSGQFRFRYKATNGNIIAVGESYKAEDDASHAVSLLHQLAPEAPVVDKTA